MDKKPCQFVKVRLSKDATFAEVVYTGKHTTPVEAELEKPYSVLVDIDLTVKTEPESFEATFWMHGGKVEGVRAECPTGMFSSNMDDEFVIATPTPIAPFLAATMARMLCLTGQEQKRLLKEAESLREGCDKLRKDSALAQIKLEEELKAAREEIESLKATQPATKIVSDRLDRKRVFLTGMAIGKRS